jgi:hypothetical protein
VGVGGGGWGWVWGVGGGGWGVGCGRHHAFTHACTTGLWVLSSATTPPPRSQQEKRRIAAEIAAGLDILGQVRAPRMDGEFSLVCTRVCAQPPPTPPHPTPHFGLCLPLYPRCAHTHAHTHTHRCSGARRKRPSPRRPPPEASPPRALTPQASPVPRPDQRRGLAARPPPATSQLPSASAHPGSSIETRPASRTPRSGRGGTSGWGTGRGRAPRCSGAQRDCFRRCTSGTCMPKGPGKGQGESGGHGVLGCMGGQVLWGLGWVDAVDAWVEAWGLGSWAWGSGAWGRGGVGALRLAP